MTLPRLLAVEEFFADPVVAAPTISLDGTRLAYLAPAHGRMNLWVRGIDEEHADAVCVTRDSRRGIKTYYWTDDPRWMLYLQDTDGNEDWHLFRVDVENLDASAVDLTPMQRGHRVWDVKRLSSMPGMVLASMNRRKDFVDVFRIEVATGEVSLHLESADASGSHILGPQGEDFYQSTANAEHCWEYFAVDRESGSRRLLARFDGPSYPLGPSPSAVTPDGSGLLLGIYPKGNDELALVRIDTTSGEQTVLAALAGKSLCSGTLASPSSLFISRRTDEVIAARFIGDRPSVEVIDQEYAPIFAALAGLSDGVIGSLSSDEAERHWLVTFTHDREPNLTYLYDHSTGNSKLVFRPYPGLDPAELAPMAGVSLTARDGLPLHAFLTLPIGLDPSELPLVMFVHGGPWAHDVWSYHPAVQFLANRGYAVLQVNYRGSTGYGNRHILAAVKEFAGAMHDDLIDAAEWAVKEGYADSSRIGIYGGSYGGYSALVAVTVTPDFFAAAVDYCGISSLPNFIRTWSATYESWGPNTFIHYCGDPNDPDQMPDLLARSPITYVDRIVTPLLVAQGANDVRVVQAEADSIVEALTARGVPVEYILAADEGHGFQNPENSFLLFRAVEKHFAQHLGGRSAVHA